jgi:hypothetical protein
MIHPTVPSIRYIFIWLIKNPSDKEAVTLSVLTAAYPDLTIPSFKVTPYHCQLETLQVSEIVPHSALCSTHLANNL